MSIFQKLKKSVQTPPSISDFLLLY